MPRKNTKTTSKKTETKKAPTVTKTLTKTSTKGKSKKKVSTTSTKTVRQTALMQQTRASARSKSRLGRTSSSISDSTRSSPAPSEAAARSSPAPSEAAARSSPAPSVAAARTSPAPSEAVVVKLEVMSEWPPFEQRQSGDSPTSYYSAEKQSQQLSESGEGGGEEHEGSPATQSPPIQNEYAPASEDAAETSEVMMMPESPFEQQQQSGGSPSYSAERKNNQLRENIEGGAEEHEGSPAAQSPLLIQNEDAPAPEEAAETSEVMPAESPLKRKRSGESPSSSAKKQKQQQLSEEGEIDGEEFVSAPTMQSSPVRSEGAPSEGDFSPLCEKPAVDSPLKRKRSDESQSSSAKKQKQHFSDEEEDGMDYHTASSGSQSPTRSEGAASEEDFSPLCEKPAFVPEESDLASDVLGTTATRPVPVPIILRPAEPEGKNQRRRGKRGGKKHKKQIQISEIQPADEEEDVPKKAGSKSKARDGGIPEGSRHRRRRT